MNGKRKPFQNKFAVIELSTEDLGFLDAEERNFVLAASFIINDIRFYWSLMARSPIDSADRDLRAMQYVRWLWSTRKLAGAVYEAIDTLDHFSGKIPIARACGPVVPRNLRQKRFLALAKTFRNKATHHFAKEGIDSELLGFEAAAVHREFANEHTGNSLSEIGEQVFTLAIGNKMMGGDFTKFNDWLRHSSASIMNFCGKVVAEILTTRFPERTYSERTISVTSEAEPPTHRWPLFLKV